MPKKRGGRLTPAERERRIKAGLILLSVGEQWHNKALIADGAEWSFTVRAWLMPDQATYERWVRIRLSDPFDGPTSAPDFDPDDPYDRFGDVLAKRKKP